MPNKVLLAVFPPVDPAEQLLPQSYRIALSQLLSSYCHRLQSYRHSVGWAEDPTYPDCYSSDYMVANLFSCPTHQMDLFPLEYVRGTLPGNSIPGGPPAVCQSAPTADRIRLLSSLTFIFRRRSSLPLAAPAEPHHLLSPPLLLMSYHLICGLEVDPPPPIRYPTITVQFSANHDFICPI